PRYLTSFPTRRSSDLSEIELIKNVSAKVGVKPLIGIRAKLATRGSGRWESSGGDRSKFGLSAREMLDAVAYLRECNMLDSFVLLDRKSTRLNSSHLGI